MVLKCKVIMFFVSSPALPFHFMPLSSLLSIPLSSLLSIPLSTIPETRPIPSRLPPKPSSLLPLIFLPNPQLLHDPTDSYPSPLRNHSHKPQPDILDGVVLVQERDVVFHDGRRERRVDVL